MGFTLVEIIVTIVLLGIVSAVIFSRLSDSSSFNPSMARDQIISQTRTTQQQAIGRNAVTLTIQPTGSQIVITTADESGTIRAINTPFDDVILAGDINQLASCGTTPGATAINAGSGMRLYFDSLGDLVEVAFGAAAATAVSTGARICINDNPIQSVCVSAAGFAYAGDCDD